MGWFLYDNGLRHERIKRKYLFHGKFVSKTKLVRWSWNLEPQLIGICRIRWWISFYSFLDWKYPFWVNLVQKTKIVSLRQNLVSRLFRICKIRWWCSHFCKFYPENQFGILMLPAQSRSSPFAENWSQWLFLLLQQKKKLRAR